MRAFGILLVMDFRELLASRSYWLLLLAVCALSGQSFITAVELYAEASGAGGGPAALAQGLSPLDGILVPTLGAYDLAATLLFPFVVIRLIAEERATGAVWLQLQWPASFGVTMASKGVTLLGGWLLALLPGMTAIILWHQVGGHLYAPETAALMLGYVLRGVAAIGICAAAAAFSASAASAAVVALAFTIGTWALDYFAAARGGVLAVIATYTPLAALRTFEHGELRLATIIILLVVGGAGLALAATAVPSGRSRRNRVLRSAVAIVIAILACVLGSNVRVSRDVSENRRNSFAPADEIALAAIDAPLRVTVYLAAEDPRLSDLERGVLAKLRRTVPHLQIEYSASGRSELFQKSGDHYGEIWYEIAGHRLMSRSTIEEVVLETIYEVAGLQAPIRANDVPYPGYPISAASASASSRIAPWVFFVVWPLLIAGTWFGIRRKHVQRAG
ncbi:MAG: ABC transporter permease [Gemmatimonadaceae bacterium]